MNTVYGYVNGAPVYSADEYVYAKRGFGAITSDDELVEYAKKVTYSWSNSGHRSSFATYHLSDYALAEPRQSLTKSEFDRLVELQKGLRDKRAQEEAAKSWKMIHTAYYADNSIEQVYEDVNGNRKTVTINI